MSTSKITIAYFSDGSQLVLKLKGKRTFSVSLSKLGNPPSNFLENSFFHFKKSKQEAQTSFTNYCLQHKNSLEKIVKL